MIKRNLLTLLLGLLFCVQAVAEPRTVFVQLFEWPWKDIARECEIYLGPAGFSAVQVSPPQEHILWENNPWWERYQVASYKINSRSGNEQEFKEMVERCHKVGVDIYVDAVLNHMTGIPSGRGFSGTRFEHYNYPGIYNYNDFHHCGRNQNDNINNYFDRYELQNCELLDLADLATESDYVRSRLAEYLNHLLDLGVAGFRIDAAKHMPAEDLVAIKKKLKKSAYLYSEIISDPNDPFDRSEYYPVGDVMAYDYARDVAHAFLGQNPGRLRQIADGFPASADAIVFLTNHDLERNPFVRTLSYSSSDHELYRLAQIFMLAWPYGYPHLFSGYQFKDRDAGPPLNSDQTLRPVLNADNSCALPFTCEHRAAEVAPMVMFRNQTDRYFQVNDWWSDGRDALAFSRGPAGFVAMNYSGSSTVAREFTTSMPDGEYCNILEGVKVAQKLNCSEKFFVTKGKVKVTLPPLSALVLLNNETPKKRMKSLSHEKNDIHNRF